ncbi:MAG: hypothetical protein QXL43_01770 [Methanolinea sp.]
MVGALGATPVTLTSDRSLAEIARAAPDRIILSPGPGRPDANGAMRACARRCAGGCLPGGLALGGAEPFSAALQPGLDNSKGGLRRSILCGCGRQRFGSGVRVAVGQGIRCRFDRGGEVWIGAAACFC